MNAPIVTPDPAVVELLTDLAALGARLAPEGANVRYWAPEPLAPEMRERIVALKPQLLMYFMIWSTKRARALQHHADDLVSALGVSGADPVIQEHVARCVDAHHVRDMLTVRSACFAIEARARHLAAQHRA